MVDALSLMKVWKTEKSSVTWELVSDEKTSETFDAILVMYFSMFNDGGTFLH